MLVRSIILAVLFPATAVAGNQTPPPIVLQDAATKVVFYVESDRSHVAAISPNGKLLWCIEVFPQKTVSDEPFAISDIRIKNKESLLYKGFGGAGVTGEIDKKTGAIRPYNPL